jgi:hypothetical protein
MKFPLETTVRKVLASSVSIGTPLLIEFIDINPLTYSFVKTNFEHTLLEAKASSSFVPSDSPRDEKGKNITSFDEKLPEIR